MAIATLVTVQEFLQMPEPEGQKLELIGGEVVNGHSRKFEPARTLEDPLLPGFSALVSSIFEGI